MNTNKKYELFGLPVIYFGRTLYRIRAVRDFSDVSTGDIGGFVQSESNLSHDGTCWIYGDGKCMDRAKVTGNARVRGGNVYGSAIVHENATVMGRAIVKDNCNVGGCSTVKGCANVYGNAHVLDGVVTDNADVHGEAVVYGIVKGYANVYGNYVVSDGETVKWLDVRK